MHNNITSGPVLWPNVTAMEAYRSLGIEALYGWIKSLYIH